MNIEEIAKKLIEIPSVTDSPNESDPTIAIKNILEKQAKDVRVNILGNGTKRNLIAVIGKGKIMVMLNGHFDVVAGSRQLFSPLTKNERIYGRGAVDDKGPLACLIQAFIELSWENLKGKVILTCVCDEENAGAEGSQTLAKMSIVGDYNIIAEPTSLTPIISEKGFLRLKIISLGKPAHAAFPERGINAIENLYKGVNEIRSLVVDGNSDILLGNPTLSFNIVNGGNKINIVPDLAEGYVDIRFLPCQKPELLTKRIKLKLISLGNLSASVISIGEPFSTNISSPLVKVASFYCDKKPQGISFATDARFFNLKESIVLGPGDPMMAHCLNESVSLRQLYKAKEIYKKIVLDVLELTS